MSDTATAWIAPPRANMTAACAALAGFIACVWAANAAIDRWGFVDLHVLGLVAPAGVFFAGLTFQLRDIAQEHGGLSFVFVGIFVGTLLSMALSPQLALASGIAFLFSESLDLAIYTPLRRRQWLTAVALSGLAGSLLDSWLFLWLAPFPCTLAAWAGLVLGKLVVVAAFVALAAPARRTLAPTAAT